MTENDLLVLARATADEANMHGFKHTAAAMQRVIDQQIDCQETIRQQLRDAHANNAVMYQ